jgi:hypothetical protein
MDNHAAEVTTPGTNRPMVRISHRARRGLPLLATVVALLSVTVGCTGEDDQKAKEFGGGDNPDPTATSTQKASCRAEVALTGAFQDSWTGDASVATTEFEGPPAVYVARHGKTEVRLFAGDSADKASVTVTDGGASWGVTPPTHGSIHADGTGASVDTEAVRDGEGGPDVHVRATFHC